MLPTGLTSSLLPGGLILPKPTPPHTHTHTHTGASADITGSFLSHVFAYAVPSDYLVFPSFSFPIRIQPHSHPLGDVNEDLLPCLPKDFVPSQICSLSHASLISPLHWAGAFSTETCSNVSNLNKQGNTLPPSLYQFLSLAPSSQSSPHSLSPVFIPSSLQRASWPLCTTLKPLLPGSPKNSVLSNLTHTSIT